MKDRYDGVADWYDESAAPSADFSRDAIVGLAGAGDGRCLDLGCGTGLYTSMLESTGRTVFGLDLSEDQLRLACERGRVSKAVRGHVGALPFAATSFELVTAIWLHGDVEDLGGLLRESARVLAPGGRFLLYGIHPCFNGPAVEGAEGGGRVVHPIYRVGGWHDDSPWWGTGIRRRVGVYHRTLADLLNEFLRSDLVLEEVVEPRDDPVPAVLAILARRP